MNVDPATIATDLRAGAKWVRQGWTRGAFYDPRNGGKVCLVGGLASAVHGTVPRAGSLSLYTLDQFTEDEHNRLATAMAAVNDYLAANDMLDLNPDPDNDEPVRDAVEWNDLRCPGGEDCALLLEAVAAQVERVTS